jgi:cytochrome b involved in lipid metabolism
VVRTGAAKSSVHRYVTDVGQSAGRLQLEHARPMPTGGTHSSTMVDVYTSDGEHFPVKKRLLRPCITLTALVRAPERAQCNVDVDTLTFDRVLIFLESVALCRPAPTFAVHLLEDLRAAGQKLQCQSLVSFCEGKLRGFEARITIYRWQDVKEANSKGRSWLVLDGMVLDVTDWLSEHPGGSTIIPAQALNVDCSRFFEVYHTSCESFLYLKEFYIGEVSALDLEEIDVAEAPSQDFLSQLRGFTGWRISNRDELPFRSF